MKYRIEIQRPGIDYYDRKSGEPVAFAPDVVEIDANSHTEALITARRVYAETGLGFSGNFNVGPA